MNAINSSTDTPSPIKVQPVTRRVYCKSGKGDTEIEQFYGYEESVAGVCSKINHIRPGKLEIDHETGNKYLAAQGILATLSIFSWQIFFAM